MKVIIVVVVAMSVLTAGCSDCSKALITLQENRNRNERARIACESKLKPGQTCIMVPGN